MKNLKIPISDEYLKFGGDKDNDNNNDLEIINVNVEKKCMYLEDLMSAEEFSLKVEAFIARH